MLASVFDSRELSSGDRLAAWQALKERTLAPNEFFVPDPASFHASFRTANLGAVQVAAMRYSALRSRRTPELIRRSDPGHYVVGLFLNGRQRLAQKQLDTTLETRELVLFTDSRPYEAQAEPGDGQETSASVMVRFEAGAVPLPARHLDRLLATALPGETGPGAMLTTFLAHLAKDTGPYGPEDRARLGTVLVDLLTAWLAHHLDLLSQTPAETRQRVQFLQIRSFIHQHLGDADLSPGGIAAAHHMSLRALHRLFQDHGFTVASFIRGQRLLRARRELADPQFAGRPVYVIAHHWGFSHPSDFSRAFRAEYGMSPSDYRALHLPRS